MKRSRKPGRPMAFSRPEAVRAAMNTFWKNGFEAVSVSDLADAMGIERSSFYNTFKDRESVFLEALDLYRGLAPDAVLLTARKGAPVVPVIRAMLREICRVRSHDPEARGCLVVNSIGALVGTNDTLGPRIEEAVRGARTVLEKVLRIGIDQGEIRPVGDVRATAGLFVAFLAGLNSVSKVIRDEKELWRICQSFLASIGIDRE
ncbi:MAG: TetR/AcrR family transcriptional regulator [Pseudomonadota bacterium]